MARKTIEEVLANDSATVGAMFGTSKNEAAPEMRMIAWDKIRANAANFYGVDDVEDLVNSIKMHGLLDPVVVTPQDDGTWLLISGHRRHKAWGVLREEDPVLFAEIPAIVRQFASGPMAELALIMANSSARRLSAPEISQQAQRVEELLYELKEQGYSFPGRMRDQVAKACDVSATKLARLKVIRENLSPSFERYWLEGGLAEATAYELARTPVWVQEKIFKACNTPSTYGVIAVREFFEEGCDYSGEGLSGPGCEKCNHGDAFLRHDLENGKYSSCKGETCCLKCEQSTRSWSPCSRMCAKAKAQRKEASDKQKAEKDREREKRETKLRASIRASAARLTKAADTSGVDDKVKIKTRYGEIPMKVIRAAAAGDFSTPAYAFSYVNPFLTSEGFDVASAAKTLKCSADYICGLADELKPSGSFAWAEPREYEPPIVEAEQVISEAVSESDTYRPGDMQFRPGKPKERTLAWCAFVIDGTEMTSIAVYWPHLDAWCFEHGARIDAECVGWYPVPDWRGVLRDEPREG